MTTQLDDSSLGGPGRGKLEMSHLSCGRLAQLGEHHVRNVGVVGSNPMPSTKFLFGILNYRASIDVKDRRTQTLKEAWIGDAVLALYARLRILGEDGAIDGAKSIRMTSNQFLSAFGEPSEVEAQIGRVFEEEGLDAAFAYVRDRFMPLYEKQEAGRRHRAK